MNLLAANVNAPSIKCSGSGIYGGQSGALQVFVSESPATKILIAKIPIDPLQTEHNSPKTDKVAEEKSVKTRSLSNTENDSNEKESIEGNSNESVFGNPIGKFLNFFRSNIKIEDLPYQINLSQDDLSEYTVKFLDFSENLRQSGSVCNKAICCNYNVEVDDFGMIGGKVKICLFFLNKHALQRLW